MIPKIIAKKRIFPIFSDNNKKASIAVKIGYRYCITVASGSEKRCMDSKTKKSAIVPTKPLNINILLLLPSG